MKRRKKNNLIIFIILILILCLGYFGFKKVFSKEKEESNNESTTTTITSTTTTTPTTSSTTTTTITTKTTTTTKKTTKPTTTTKSTPSKDLTGTSSKGYSITYKNGIYYVNGYLIANKTYSLPENYNPGGLDSKTESAANEMFADFKAATGLEMWSQSGFRSYSIQKSIYERYVKRDGKTGADRYSARPGHSEHQTGLAFDVCVGGNYYKDKCINSKFNDTSAAKWLSENASNYGFILRYPKGKENETGYKYESWHFRYVGKELAKALYNDGNWLTMEDYFGIDSKYSD